MGAAARAERGAVKLGSLGPARPTPDRTGRHHPRHSMSLRRIRTGKIGIPRPGILSIAPVLLIRQISQPYDDVVPVRPMRHRHGVYRNGVAVDGGIDAFWEVERTFH